MADIINRLLLETKDFDAKLSNSKKGVNDYQGSVTDMAKKASAGIVKFAGAIGIAMGASEAFTKTVNSSQTTGDAWVKLQDQMKASADSFFASIAMGNFDGFLSNLQNVIDKAGDLSVALDNLGTKTLFNNSEVNVLNSQYQLELNAAKARNISDEERNAHLAKAKGYLLEIAKLQGSLASANRETSYTALQAEIAKQGFSGNVAKETWDFLLKDSNRGRVEAHAAKYNNTVSDYESKISRSRRFDTKTEVYVDTPETADLKKQLEVYEKTRVAKFGELTSVFIQLADDEKSTVASALKMRDTANNLAVSISQKELEIANTDAKINGSYNKQNGNGNGSKTPPPVIGSIGEIDAELSKLNKKLIIATTMQARIATQTTINELEAKKVSIKTATDKGVFTTEHGENKFDVNNISKNFLQYTDVDKQISVKRKELISTTTEEARSAVLSTIDELEAKKVSIKVSLEKEVSNSTIDKQSQTNVSEYIDIDNKIANQRTTLISTTTEEARSAVQSTIDELESKKIELIANIDIKSNISSEIAGVINGGTDRTKGSKGMDLAKNKLPKFQSPINKKDINLLESYQDNLYGISDAMRFMSNAVEGGASSWLNWGASLLQSIAQAIPAIRALIPALAAKTAGEAASSAAQIPLVGWLAAGGAALSIISLFASLPKFADGGVMQGGSTFGDLNLARVNAGEMILNKTQQGNLFRLLDGGNITSKSVNSGAVSFIIQGKDLVGVLSNYNNQKNKVR